MEIKIDNNSNIYDGVTVVELLEGYGIYKQLLNNKLLIIDKKTKLIMIDGDESIKYLENQNLELEKSNRNYAALISTSIIKDIANNSVKRKLYKIKKMCYNEMNKLDQKNPRFAKPLAYDIINIIEKEELL